jgi:hypothetical protein
VAREEGADAATDDSAVQRRIDTTARSKRRAESKEKRRIILKDQRLGARRADATHWKCRRLDDDEGGDNAAGRGTLLHWCEDDDDIAAFEWPIKSCSAATIRERWGPGRYIVDYMNIDEKGQRKPRGRSRALLVKDRSARASSEARPQTPGTLATTNSTVPAAALTTATIQGAMAQMDPTNLFSMFAYFQNQQEKATERVQAEARLSAERAQAEAKAASERTQAETKVAIERAQAEVKMAHERYQADLTFQLERERLASAERVAQIEAQARVAAIPARAPRFDPEDLMKRMDERMDAMAEQVNERFDALEEGPSAPVAPDNATAMMTMFKDTVAPLLMMVANKFSPTPPPLPDAALPPIAGRGGGNDDPKGEPN